MESILFCSFGTAKTEWNALDGSPPVPWPPLLHGISRYQFQQWRYSFNHDLDKSPGLHSLQCTSSILQNKKNNNNNHNHNHIIIVPEPLDTELLVGFTGLLPFFYLSGGGSKRSNCPSRHIHSLATTCCWWIWLMLAPLLLSRWGGSPTHTYCTHYQYP